MDCRDALAPAEEALRLVGERVRCTLSGCLGPECPLCGLGGVLVKARTALAAVRSAQARLTVGDWFERLGSAVERLHEANARHKRGFRLQESLPTGMLLHAISEIVEVSEAETREHTEQELGDVLAILVHYTLVMHLDLKDVCRRWLAKIPEDFPDVPPLVVKRTGDPI